MAAEAKSDANIPQASEDEVRQQLAVQQFSAAQREVQMLATRVAEMEMQSSEMEQVIEILKTVPKDRRTWYSVDGVLVEMTAGQTIPKLYEQRAHLSKQIDDVTKDVDNKKEMLADFAIKQKLVVPVYKDDKKGG
eukprot:CAMPEP_0201574992 /NCGR_PEP_ID=MMETSP0190_2-20130828/19879_1 /ASSEMBLY_ACC=CAM_ASM_000263 /TAXON_ID=37353 /ORGANISM="Rosalina sp." /LENGTH=134 /DNA_ID=CAMNT_0048004031 /DNA_START=62 /DNA_END=463 /DNA_ORIENTATION=-